MPLASEAASNRDLDANYGDGHAASWPDAFTLHLFDDDPRDIGVELSGDGYAPAEVANDSATFPDAASGVKTSVLIPFAAATADWQTVTWWLLKDAADETWMETAAFSEPVDVVSGAVFKARLSISHDPEAI